MSTVAEDFGRNLDENFRNLHRALGSVAAIDLHIMRGDEFNAEHAIYNACAMAYMYPTPEEIRTILRARKIALSEAKLLTGVVE